MRKCMGKAVLVSQKKRQNVRGKVSTANKAS